MESMADSCVMFSVNGWYKTIEMKKLVVHGTFLQNKMTTTECQNQNTVTTGKIGGSFSTSQEMTPNGWENVLMSNKRCLHKHVYTKKSENNNSGGHSTGSISDGDQHRLLPPPGGNGKNPGGLPKDSSEINKEAANKGLLSNGATRCLQNFGGIVRRMAFKNSFHFISDRSFTADGGLLWPMGGYKDNTSQDPFPRCELCKNLEHKSSGR